MNKTILYVIISLCFVAWVVWGAFPLMSYESDSMRLINGVVIMHNTNSGLPPTLSYQYNMQPLVSAILLGIKHTVPGWGVEHVYAFLSALMSVVFFFLSVEFVRMVTRTERLVVMLCLFLLPESFAVATYPNTAVFSAVFFLVGMIALWKDKLWLAAMGLCLAPLFRYDVLMVYPAVFGLFLVKGDGLIPSLKKSVAWALAVIALMWLGCLLLKTNPLQTITDLNANGTVVRYQAVVPYVILSFYTIVNIVLLPWAIARSVAGKQWTLLLMALVPMLLLHLAYAKQGTAAKHYLYLLPFITILTAPLVSAILQRRYGLWCKYLFVVGIIIYNLLSVRASLPKSDRPPLDTKQWMNQPDATSNIGPVRTLATENLTPLHLRFGIGAGQVVATADERMLFTGNLFYPFYIHRFKTRWNSQVDHVVEWLHGKGDCLLCSGSIDALSAYANRWLEKGAELEYSEHEDAGNILNVYDMKENGRRILFLHERATADKEILRRLIHKASGIRKGKFYVVTLHDFETFCAEKFVEEGWLKKETTNIYSLNATE